ncbi:hypothetical protein BH24ACI4_BH24ACI4_00470 [soil metagenome]
MIASSRPFVTRLAASCLLLLAACGQKGPPLAPLRLVPAAATEVSVRRVEDRARVRLVLPSANANGPGPVEIDRVEIFAVTVGPGVPPPPDRDLMTRPYLVGQIQVRPAPVEGEAPTEGDTRPAPGEPVTFEEALTAQVLTPAPLPSATAVEAPAPAAPPGTPAADPAAGEKPAADATAGKPAPAAKPATAGKPATAATTGEKPAADATEGTGKPAPESGPDGTPAAAAPAAAKPPAHPVRLYVARGVTRGGRPGPPSTRVSLPVLPVPPPPTAIAARSTEAAVVLEWTPPAAAPDASYNIYAGEELARPVNVSPLEAVTFEHAVPFGEERCYRVRSVAISGDVLIEGTPSEPTCITPRDTFPPAAPQGLAAVPTPGQISLVWDANTEKDLAGYLVLRGDAPDGPLRALTATPIRETSYRDAAVTPGNRYIYAVVAVDTATPPNTSAQSAQLEETAR